LKVINWKTNIAAGITVGIVALPLAIAFAVASGVKPEQGICTAIIAGLVVGMIFFVVRSCQSFVVSKQAHSLYLPDGVVYTIDGPFFFGTADKIERTLSIVNVDTKFVVFRLVNAPFIDMTGLKTFSRIIDKYCKSGIKVAVVHELSNLA